MFAATADFLRSKLPDAPSCLVLDVRLPGVSGLDFQTQLAAANIRIPVIIMTGHGDIPRSVRAMKAGEVDFLDRKSGVSGKSVSERVALGVCRILKKKNK